jgi:hypothetical protein
MNKVRSALKSIEGAIRHAELMGTREEREAL